MQSNVKQLTKMSFILTAILTGLTSIHHFYGGMIYHTSWRIHGIAGAGVAIVAAYFAYRQFMKNNDRRGLLVYLAVSTVVLGLLVGVYEGVYNHLLKDLLYFMGVDHTLWGRLFPAPIYEVPDNWFFEVTGVIQAFIGVAILYVNTLIHKQAQSIQK
jgi:hypothetical protein